MTISLVVLPTGLRVQFTGADRIAAGSRGLDVPFERIVGSRVMTRGAAMASSPRLPCPGSWWPGRLRAGSRGVGESRQLWAVRRGAHVLVVYLSGRPFHRVVVDVEDPQRTHRGIEAVLLHSKKNTVRQSLRDLLRGGGDDELGSASAVAPGTATAGGGDRRRTGRVPRPGVIPPAWRSPSPSSINLGWRIDRDTRRAQRPAAILSGED